MSLKEENSSKNNQSISSPYNSFGWGLFVSHCSSKFAHKVLTSVHQALDKKIVSWKGIIKVDPPRKLYMFILSNKEEKKLPEVVSMNLKDIGTYNFDEKTLHSHHPISLNIQIRINGFYLLLLLSISFLFFFLPSFFTSYSIFLFFSILFLSISFFFSSFLCLYFLLKLILHNYL